MHSGFDHHLYMVRRLLGITLTALGVLLMAAMSTLVIRFALVLCLLLMTAAASTQVTAKREFGFAQWRKNGLRVAHVPR